MHNLYQKEIQDLAAERHLPLAGGRSPARRPSGSSSLLLTHDAPGAPGSHAGLCAGTWADIGADEKARRLVRGSPRLSLLKSFNDLRPALASARLPWKRPDLAAPWRGGPRASKRAHGNLVRLWPASSRLRCRACDQLRSALGCVSWLPGAKPQRRRPYHRELGPS